MLTRRQTRRMALLLLAPTVLALLGVMAWCVIA